MTHTWDKPPIPLVPLSECVEGRIYRLQCRNLAVGVFNDRGDGGFIGIRTKWNKRFLDTEYHWDTGAPYGTVRGAVDLGVDLPREIIIATRLGDEPNDALFSYLETIEAWAVRKLSWKDGAR